MVCIFIIFLFVLTETSNKECGELNNFIFHKRTCILWSKTRNRCSLASQLSVFYFVKLPRSRIITIWQWEFKVRHQQLDCGTPCKYMTSLGTSLLLLLLLLSLQAICHVLWLWYDIISKPSKMEWSARRSTIRN